MAYQIAQAYDENKNLVPLYVLTDGEVPEVSPGFDVTATSYDNVVVTATSSNPVGGAFEDVYTVNGGSLGYTVSKVTVNNNSPFKIKVVVIVDSQHGESEIEPYSSQVISMSNGGNII